MRKGAPPDMSDGVSFPMFEAWWKERTGLTVSAAEYGTPFAAMTSRLSTAGPQSASGLRRKARSAAAQNPQHLQSVTAAEAAGAVGADAPAASAWDGTVRVWDLRQRCCSYVLPGHSNLISEARFDATGEALLTASFDGRVKVWGARDWRLLGDLSGHEGKVMAADFACPPPAGGGGKKQWSLFSVGYDRTLKQWQNSAF